MQPGDRIRQIRKGLRLNQDDFAARLGLAKHTVLNYEKGIRLPTAESLIKIADLADVTIDWILTGREPKDRPEAQAKVSYIDPAVRIVAEELEKYPDLKLTARERQELVGAVREILGSSVRALVAPRRRGKKNEG